MFFNLFFEVEPFDSNYDCSRNLWAWPEISLGGIVKFETESGEEVLGERTAS